MQAVGMRPLLIGQAPGPNTNPDYPLFPAPSRSAGARLADIMGLSRGEYLRAFDRANLIPEFPGKDGNGEDKFPRSPARFAAQVMRPLLRGRTVVLVGRQVAQAFGVESDWHEWQDLQVGPYHAVTRCPGVARIAVVPHPSGRNHWYNSELNRASARRFWESLLQKSAPDDRKVLPFPAA